MTKYVGIWGNHTGDGGSTSTFEAEPSRRRAHAHGVYGARQLGSGDVAINAENLTITTKGLYSYGAIGLHTGTGAIDIDVQGGRITTRGMYSNGIYGQHQGSGDIDIDVRDLTITTESTDLDPTYGDTFSHGISADHIGSEGNMTSAFGAAVSRRGG